MVEKDWAKDFDKCPVCGGKERFFEKLGQELEERGLTPAGMKFYYDSKGGPFAGKEVIEKLPIGGEIPAFGVATDICIGCGAIYVVRLERGSAKKGLAIPTPVGKLDQKFGSKHPFNPLMGS